MEEQVTVAPYHHQADQQCPQSAAQHAAVHTLEYLWRTNRLFRRCCRGPARPPQGHGLRPPSHEGCGAGTAPRSGRLMLIGTLISELGASEGQRSTAYCTPGLGPIASLLERLGRRARLLLFDNTNGMALLEPVAPLAATCSGLDSGERGAQACLSGRQAVVLPPRLARLASCGSSRARLSSAEGETWCRRDGPLPPPPCLS